MKNIIFKSGIILLFLLVMVVGCQKKGSNDPNNIFGKWQNIKNPENCVGFGDKIIEITADSIFRLYVDDKMNFTSTFFIKTGSMGYDTIFYDNHTGYYSWVLITLKNGDTLHLVPPIFTLTSTCDFYKRKN